MKFCTNCGKQLSDEAAFCSVCGKPVSAPMAPAYTPVAPAYAPVQSNADLVNKLSERVKMNGIIWIVIAVIQILVGLLGAWFTLIVGVLNIISAIKDLQYSKTVLQNPTGIVATFEPLASPIITLAYNLVIGGVIGVVGSIYYFVALRGFVMENKNAFLALEQNVNTTAF